MDINRLLKENKDGLLKYFRGRAKEILSELSLQYGPTEYKKKSSALNKSMIQSKENLLAIIHEYARTEHWTNREILECVLMITYTNDVVLLETRNSVWEYDYMAFSRRIGELWEPFCKICFSYPLTNIKSFIPPLFEDVKRNLSNEITDYINGLKIKKSEREQLIRYYNKVWGLVTSGEIKLECDLHFVSHYTKYVVDFKSGFGSNEKGNTNRLLLVGSVYNNIASGNYKCLMFVRSMENNHYLTTLRNSGLWTVYCGEETYEQIQIFTGFNLNDWIDRNIDWMNDFSDEMKKIILKNKLNNYLKW